MAGLGGVAANTVWRNPLLSGDCRRDSETKSRARRGSRLREQSCSARNSLSPRGTRRQKPQRISLGLKAERRIAKARAGNLAFRLAGTYLRNFTVRTTTKARLRIVAVPTTIFSPSRLFIAVWTLALSLSELVVKPNS